MKPTIGLEMHTVLNSKTKVFTKSLNEYSNIPNNLITPGDVSHPGTLPTLNKEAVRKSIMMAKALNCEIADYLLFDRKNYFYPDLAKGYQITQNTKPIGLGGYLDIEVNNEVIRTYIHDIHLEEDTASLDHYKDYTLIDYNRSGSPLLEIVTEPSLKSADEAVAFLEHVRNIYLYTGASDADTKKGQIRCDLNISIMDGDNLGTKVEIKNVNSFSAAHAAITYEINRQLDLINNGKRNEIIKETRRWDEEKEITISMREKNDAVDYLYHVDGNIPKIYLSKDFIEDVIKQMPELPLERKHKYINKYNLNAYDAGVLVREKSISDYFEECLKLNIDPKEASNWITSQIMGYLNEEGISINDIYLTPAYLKELLDILNNGLISSKQAKEVFNLSLKEKTSPSNIINKYNIKQMDDKAKLNEIIDNILKNNPTQVKEYKEGKTKLFQFFTGQVMKETKGNANPDLVREILQSKLD